MPDPPAVLPVLIVGNKAPHRGVRWCLFFPHFPQHLIQQQISITPSPKCNVNLFISLHISCTDPSSKYTLLSQHGWLPTLIFKCLCPLPSSFNSAACHSFNIPSLFFLSNTSIPILILSFYPGLFSSLHSSGSNITLISFFWCLFPIAWLYQLHIALRIKYLICFVHSYRHTSDIMGSFPDHHSKVTIIIKGVTWNFWFSCACKSYVYMVLAIKGGIALCPKRHLLSKIILLVRNANYHLSFQWVVIFFWWVLLAQCW